MFLPGFYRLGLQDLTEGLASFIVARSSLNRALGFRAVGFLVQTSVRQPLTFSGMQSPTVLPRKLVWASELSSQAEYVRPGQKERGSGLSV